MSDIEFSKDEKAIIGRKIQMYFREELDQELGSFDAEFLLDFFATEIGTYFYNRGIYDAQAILLSQVENLTDSIYQLEKPTQFTR